MSETTAPIRIDFVSDVSCPWFAIGLQALEQAIARVGDDASVELHFQPFELNPALAAEGEDAIEQLTAKYGMSEQQARDNGEAIRARGAALGFTFDMDRRRHVWNNFDAPVRTSVVSGTRLSVRVDLGGRRTITTKTQTTPI